MKQSELESSYGSANFDENDNDNDDYYDDDVMNISMFLIRYTCSGLYSLTYILHSLIILSIKV